MLRGYLRVSTNKQRENTSIEEQERRLRALADMRGEPITLYIDDGVSGSIPLAKRPKGGVLATDLQRGDTIAATKLDRAFRSCADAIALVDDFHKRGIKVVLLDMGTEPLDESPVGKFFFTILAAAAEFDRARIRERVIDGKRAKKAKGGHIGGEAPYGHRVAGKGQKATLKPREDEQELIQKVQELHQGFTLREIAEGLASMGIRNRRGRVFHPQTISRIIGRA